MSFEYKEKVLIEALERQLGDVKEPIGLASKLVDISLDSLRFMLLLLDLQERHANYKIDIKKIAQVETVQDLMNIMEEA